MDNLVGYWFWWDAAGPQLKWVYHGEIVAHLQGGYCVLRFDRNDQLPEGVHEVVHISRIADEKWSIFQNANQLQAVMTEAAAV